MHRNWNIGVFFIWCRTHLHCVLLKSWHLLCVVIIDTIFAGHTHIWISHWNGAYYEILKSWRVTMLIHLSKFEFHSKGKQIIAVQDIENKTPLHPREIIFALTLAMLAQIPVPSSNHSKYLCFRIYSFSLATVSYFSFFSNSSILHSFVPNKPLLSAKNC